MQSVNLLSPTANCPSVWSGTDDVCRSPFCSRPVGPQLLTPIELCMNREASTGKLQTTVNRLCFHVNFVKLKAFDTFGIRLYTAIDPGWQLQQVLNYLILVDSLRLENNQPSIHT